MSGFDGLGVSLSNLSRRSNAVSRSISPENFTGAAGAGGRAKDGTGAICARDLGVGWKVSPSVEIAPGETFTLGEITGSGAIQQFWISLLGQAKLRCQILRMYWDDQEHPAVEVPLGDFFCNGWGPYSQVSSLAVCQNPARGYNCYWEMPFRRRAKVTLENRDDETAVVYYQLNYTLTDVPEDRLYFHAQFRRTNPVPYGEVHTLLDGVEGVGHYVGTYMAWGVNNSGWWGEGEIKFYIDDDVDFPTICGTGTEDYFCGSHNFDTGTTENHTGVHAVLAQKPNAYTTFTTPYSGLCQALRPDGTYLSQQRFGMYRWHLVDPVRFRERLRVTIQALGWRTDNRNRRYLPLQDDLASTVFWYQSLPTKPFPPLQSRDYLEVI